MELRRSMLLLLETLPVLMWLKDYSFSFFTIIMADEPEDDEDAALFCALHMFSVSPRNRLQRPALCHHPWPGRFRSPSCLRAQGFCNLAFLKAFATSAL